MCSLDASSILGHGTFALQPYYFGALSFPEKLVKELPDFYGT